MNYIKIVIAVVIALNIFNCKEGAIPESGDIRGHFHWGGNIKGEGTSNYWTIECNDSCDNCYAFERMSTSTPHILDTNKHREIFTYCKGLPASPIIVPPTDTDEVVPLGEVVFSQGDDSLFGTDLWRTCREGFVEEINYRSIEAGNHARIKIELTEGILKEFKKIVVVLDEPVTQNYVSFAAAYNDDTLCLYHRSNIATIYTNNAAPDEALIEVKVLGISDPKQPACLAGDCQGSGDRLQIVLYQQKTQINNHLYYVNHPDSQPTPSRWKRDFNKVLQQAVVEIDTVYASSINDSSWDINGNGMVDCPIGLGMLDSFNSGINTIYNELGLLLPSSDECYKNTWSSSFIVKHPLRIHYILDKNASVGDTVLYFKTVEGLETGMSLRLSPFYSPDSIEYLFIEAVDLKNKSIEFRNMRGGISGLQKNYNTKNAITASTDELAAGITPKVFDADVECASCSFSSSRPINTYIHEFLHQVKNGNLKHVGDEADPNLEKDNILYPTSDRIDTQLRFRTLRPYHTRSSDRNQNQWTQMNR
jgi:hypothetical protein